MRTIIHDTTVVAADDSCTLQYDAALVVADDRIAAIGPTAFGPRRLSGKIFPCTHNPSGPIGVFCRP